MNNQVFFVVCCFMYGVVCYFNVVEMCFQEIFEEFIMIVWYVNNFGIFVVFVENFLDNVVVQLWLVLGVFQVLVICDIVDQIDCFGIIVFQEIQQQFGLVFMCF